MQAEKFVRLLYNGRVVRPNFCQRDECPLRTYRSHVMQFLVPEDLEVPCARVLSCVSPFDTADARCLWFFALVWFRDS